MQIQISAQYGEPKAADVFFPLQKHLNDNFEKYLTKNHFKTIDGLSIIFRVSGKIHDFQSEGPERMRYIKKDRDLTIDLVFSEVQWKGVDSNDLKALVKSGVIECMRMLIEKAEILKELLDKKVFIKEVEVAMNQI